MTPPSRPGPTRHAAGFTFLELAIVLVVLGLIMGTGAQLVSLSSDYNQVKTTKNRLDEIEKALVSYVQTNRRLPCPDVDSDADGYDGEADPPGPTANCVDDQNPGQIPWRTLGLGANHARDGWGSRIVYRVDDAGGLTAGGGLNLTDCAPSASVTGNESACSSTTNPADYICEKGLQVNDPDGILISRPDTDGAADNGKCDLGEPAPTGAAYVIISYGSDEEAVVGNNGVNEDVGGPYRDPDGNDDLVRYKTILNLANEARLGPQS